MRMMVRRKIVSMIKTNKKKIGTMVRLELVTILISYSLMLTSKIIYQLLKRLVFFCRLISNYFCSFCLLLKFSFLLVKQSFVCLKSSICLIKKSNVLKNQVCILNFFTKNFAQILRCKNRKCFEF